MTIHPMIGRVSIGLCAVMLLAAVGVGCTGASSPATAAVEKMPAADVSMATEGWVWPVVEVRIVRSYLAPAHEYGPGHRGIDLDSGAGGAVRAPAGGVVAFAGSIAGRGILTIDHGGGLVTTLEPVESELVPGTVVSAAQAVAAVSTGGHAAPGTLHFGVRLNGEYINPLVLLGGIPRAILLPCC